MKTDDAAFDDSMVEGCVMDVIRNSAPDCLDDLVGHLPGVYPTDALSAVDRLGDRGDIDCVTLARVRRRRGSVENPPSWPNPLPVPHPLDFDWRFSRSAVERLVFECGSRLSGTPALLLGAPSVYWALRQRGDIRSILLDANPSVIDALAQCDDDGYECHLCDLRYDRLPDEQFAVVVVDPPWYREHERMFLWAAAQVCRPGSTVLVSMPPEGTRPGIGAEREEAFAWARRLGFEIEQTDCAALPYVSPPFERNALAAVGLDGMPLEWRRGDLVTLRLHEICDVPRPKCEPESRWPEVTIGSVRIRVRVVGHQKRGTVADPRLTHVVPGDVLNTVSRRDPRRAEVAMWTTGNRVFATHSPELLLVVVRSLGDAGDAESRITQVVGRPLTAREKRNVASALAQVSAVVAAEQAELVAMGWAA